MRKEIASSTLKSTDTEEVVTGGCGQPCTLKAHVLYPTSDSQKAADMFVYFSSENMFYDYEGAGGGDARF